MPDYLFLGCHKRLGTFRPKGPVTGQQLSIGSTGNWINEDDGYELLEITIPFFCHRQNKVIEIKPVHELSYTEDQLKTKPAS